MPPKLDTPIKSSTKTTSRSNTTNKPPHTTVVISNADLMAAVLTSFKSEIFASNKSLSDHQASRYRDLKTGLAGVPSQTADLGKENARLQSEIDTL